MFYVFLLCVELRIIKTVPPLEWDHCVSLDSENKLFHTYEIILKRPLLLGHTH